MTTIKSVFEHSPRTLEVEKGRKYEGETYLRIMNGMFAGEDIQIPTADLLAALDATANADVKHRATAYEDATRWQVAAEENERWADECKARAEKAEAALAGSEDCRLATEKKLAEAETELEAWKHTVSVLDDELRDSQELLGQRAVELHKARAERDALAKTVERVRKLTECGAHSLLPETIRAALDPKPAFVLPTEVPARIVAEEPLYGTEHEFTLWSDGKGGTSWWHDCEDADEEDALYSGVRLMREFENHREA